jgi:hypothetical protein
MMGTDPGRLFMAKREAIAIMAARPFLREKWKERFHIKC